MASRAAALLRGARHLCEEARPNVQCIVMLRFLTASAIAGVVGWQHAPGLLSWLCATVAIYLLNGVSDIAADRANGSTRPVATGRLRVPITRAWIVLLMLGAALAGSAVSLVFALLVGAYLGLGVLYSVGPWPAKHSSLRAAVVLFLAGLLTYAAGYSITGAAATPLLMALAGSMSAWMIVGTLVKDLTDIEGDRAHGRRTLGVRQGSASICLVAGLTACLIALGTVISAVISGSITLWIISAVLGGGTICLFGAMATRHHWGARGPYRSFMMTQYAAHASVLCIL